MAAKLQYSWTLGFMLWVGQAHAVPLELPVLPESVKKSPETSEKADVPRPIFGRPLIDLSKDPSEPDIKNGNGDGNGKEAKEPEHTRDNGFLVEEAFNQEPGVVQHIFNWINTWDRALGVRTRDFAMFYTMELPLGTQKHQFSFTTLFVTSYERFDGGPPTQTGDVGDTFLNYRYQLLANDDFLWCAPRFSVILPTGDRRFGHGTGEVGYQFNLPISRYGEKFDFHFNAGYTFIPGVSAPFLPLADDHDLNGYNLGASSFWKLNTKLHLFVEVLALWFDEINELGSTDRVSQVFVNPGFRTVVCQRENIEWVLGASVPVGLTRDTPDIGVFAYMSIEFTFRDVDENKCK